MSDLQLETQEFRGGLPKGDVLIIAGDLCHARCLDPERTDKYSVDQRSRVRRFIDTALANFAHVLLVPGNHDHYDGVFDATASLLKKHLRGVSVLDNASMDIDGVRFFGTTLWTDFEGRSEACMNAVRRRVGEFFFVRKRAQDADGNEILRKFKPPDALQAFDASVSALRHCLASADGKQIVVISHHPPPRQGLNPRYAGNGLDGVYASDLDQRIWDGVHHWVHGHTHIRRTYRVGNTVFRANCHGFDGKDACARTFSAGTYFDLDA
jgi:3',5'-cyclic AMP phosphodiesterase CpdA